MKFLESLLDNKQYDVIPSVNVKVRDSVKVGGINIGLDDFCKFVRTSRGYIPKWSVGVDDKVLSEEIDYTPLISVGVAELIRYLKHFRCRGILEFIQSLGDLDSFTDLKSCFEFSSIIADYDSGLEDKNLISFYSLKYKSVDNYRGVTNRIANIMYTMSNIRKGMFCELVIDILRLCYVYSPLFYENYNSKDFDGYCKVCIDTTINAFGLHISAMLDSIFLEEDFTFGAVQYEYPMSGSQHFISDGIGLGIYSVLILMAEFFSKFAQPQRDFLSMVRGRIDDTVSILRIGSENCSCTNYYDVWNERSCFDILQKRFESCFGDDFTGKYFSSGEFKFRSFNEFYSESATMSTFCFGQVPMHPKTYVRVNEDGDKLVRDYLESAVLFKKAYGVDYPDGLNPCAKFEPMTYSSSLGLLGDMLLAYIIRDDKLKEIQKKDEEQIKVVHISVEDDTKVPARQLEDMTVKYNKLQESVVKEREQFEYMLKQKSEIIQSVSAENAELKDKLSRVFSFEEVVSEGESIDEVSIDTMIEELNNYKFVLAGGRFTLERSCKNLGWGTVSQYISVSDIRSVLDADVVCIQSKFVSHSLVDSIRKYCPNALVMYYNGTNVDGLLRSCYSFVTGYLNE